MLRYVSHGPRSFGIRPFIPMRRSHWEFFVVVQGEVALTTTFDERPVFTDAALWLFAPGHLHGWKGRPGQRCRVAVFQYDRIPLLLERLTAPAGLLALPLKAVEKRRCEALARELMPYAWVESEFKNLLADRVLLELALLILAAKGAGAAPGRNPALLKVQAAEHRFRRQMGQNPPFAHLATAAGVSEAHLRRLFWKVHRRSPRAVLHGIRMRAALRLLVETDQKLESIAAECGFGTSSNFCQAFKKLKRITPGVWRKRQPGASRRRSRLSS